MTKTEFMLISSRQILNTLTDSPTTTISDNQVSQVTTAKSLGVTIDNKLDWSSHINKLTKKVATGIGAIKLRVTLSIHTHVVFNVASKHLMTGPKGNKTHCFPRDRSRSVLLYLPTQNSFAWCQLNDKFAAVLWCTT